MLHAKRLFRSACFLLASATLVLAQTSGNYLSNPNQSDPNQSAGTEGAQAEAVRPGSINYIEGQVAANGETLNSNSVGHFALQPGEMVETGSNGYAEVLLTPGSFLRLGPNARFEMQNVGLADTQMVLLGGQALVEVDQIVNGTRLTMSINNANAEVLKKGLYDFDAQAQAVRVFDGKLRVVAHGQSREIGKEDQIVLNDNPRLKKTDFSESQTKREQLYVWSQARSQAEASENQEVAQDASGYMPVGAGWFWDPYFNYYGFWPSAYLYSPFGFGFYGGYYPGFGYGGYYGGYHGYRGFRPGYAAGVHGGVHPIRSYRAAGGFRSGGFHGGGFGGFHGGGMGMHAGGFGGGHR